MRRKLFFFLLAGVLLTQFCALTPAFGDGLAMENLPPATFGNRQAALFVKINPPILTQDTVSDTYLQLRLFDDVSKKPVPHTSFFLTVWKDDELRLRNLFHAHSGEMTIKIIPSNITANEVQVFGDELPELPAWTGYGDRVDVKAPVLLDAGLYHFEIKIFGIDYDRNIFAEGDIKTFNSWLSVGDISNHTITHGGKSYPVSIISYYDQIGNFKFDQTKKTISFEMPFDWDLKRLESQTIFVHQEIRVPKEFKEFSETMTYDGSVNGFPAGGRMLILDPYSIEDTSIVHILLTKEDILNIAAKSSQKTDRMTFAVTPLASSITQNTFDIKFDKIKARISYDSKLGAGDTIPLEISFFEPDGKLLKFVRYGFSIEDSSGKVLAENVGTDKQKPGILSTEGIDVQEIKFPSAGTYRLKLLVLSHGLEELTAYQGIASNSFTVGAGGQKPAPDVQSQYRIPSWVKNNAKWWADGTIGDGDFVQGIQYLIKQGIMKIPSSQKSQGASQTIPSWVKNNAKWWADGTIGDGDFVQGIQYLIGRGIIKV